MTQSDQPTYAPNAPQGNGFAITALILGIVSIALFCLWYISIPCAVLAIIFGVLGRKKAKAGAPFGGMAMAGIVCSCVAILIDVLVVVGVLALFGAAAANADKLSDGLEDSSIRIEKSMKELSESEEFQKAMEKAAEEADKQPQ